MCGKVASLLVFAAVISVKADDEPKARTQEYNRVWVLAEQWRNEEVIAAGKDLIRRYPDFVRVHVLVAQAYNRSHRHEPTERIVEELVASGATRTAAHYAASQATGDKQVMEMHLRQCRSELPISYYCDGRLVDLNSGGLRSAIDLARLEAALRTPEVERNNDVRMEILAQIVVSNCKDGQPCEKSAIHIRTGLALARQIEDWQREFQFLSLEIHRLYRLRLSEESLRLRLEALALTRERETLQSESATLGALAEHYKDQGKLEEALAAVRQEHTVCLKLHDRYIAVNALVRSALLQRALGDLAGAEATMEACRTAAKEINSLYLEAVSLGGLSTVASDRGEYFRALELGTESVRLLRQARMEPQASAGIGNQGAYYEALGDWPHASAALRESLRGAVQQRDWGEQARLLNNLGELSMRTGEPARALGFLKEALELMPALVNASALAPSIHSGIAEASLALGRVPDAIAEGEIAVTIAHRLRNVSVEAAARLSLGLCQIRAGRLSEAESNLGEALALAERAGVVKVAVDARSGLAEVSLRRGHYLEALTNFGRAIDGLEAIRKELPGEQERTGFLRENWRAYERVVHVLSILHARYPQKGYDAAALGYAERGRARAMLDTLEQARRRASPVLSGAERKRQAAALVALSKAASAVVLRDTEENRHGLRKAQEAMREAGLTTQSNPLDARRIQSELVSRAQSIVEYSLGTEDSVAWYLGPGVLKMKVLPSRAAIERAVKAYRLQVTRHPRPGAGFQAYQEEARHLFQMLLAPFADDLAVTKNLVIIPDGILHYLPFETLIVSGTGDEARFLLETHAVSYAPSASALAALLTMSHGGSGRDRELLAYADPIFGASRTPRTAEVVRGVYAAAGMSFAPLPNTRTEVQEIGKLLPGKQVLRLGLDASEASVKADDLTRYRRVHFATHAILDEREPARSGIVLSLGLPGKEDGILRASEVLGLRMNADLVVLSACQTGLGQVVTGEGMLGLTRSFLYAGARRVVVSLWQASDVATLKLMTRMYGAAASGETASAALREAKLDMIRSGPAAYRHPYYWAPFVLVGLQ